MAKLKDLHIKRDETKKKELLKAIENSGITYDEIMDFIMSGNEMALRIKKINLSERTSGS